MRFANLSIKNFFSIKNILIDDINEPGLYLVTGSNLDRSRSNGAGKSSIFEAICWCLFGRTTKMGVRGQSSIVRRGSSTPCAVSINILDNGTKYTIVRERLESKARLMLVKDGSNISAKNVADTNVLIEGILGMNFDEFIRGHYLPQRSPIPFGQMTDRDLKEFFLERLLDVGWVRAAYESAKCDYVIIEDNVKKCDIEENLTKRQLEACEKKIVELKVKEDEFTKITNKSLIDYYGISTKLTEQLDCFNKAKDDKRRKIEELKSNLDKNDESVLKSVLSYISNRIREIELKLGDVERMERALSKEISKCPTCGSELNRESRKEIERAISQYDVKSLRIDLNALRLKYTDTDIKLSYINNWKQSIIELQSEGESRDIENELWRVTEKIKQLESATNPYTSLMEREKESKEIFENTLDQLSTEREYLRQSLERLEFWTHGFSGAGVQSFLLDAITPVLNQRLNECLQVLTDGEFTARFNTVKQIQSGEYREKFSLDVQNIMGGSEYSVLSGGEAQRIDLATSIVMSDLMRSRTNKQLDFICFDEPLRSLDQDGIDSFLKFVREHYDGVAVYLITHTDVDPNLFNKHLHVEKKNGITTLRRK